MHPLIVNGERVDVDHWQVFEPSESMGIPGSALLPVATWKASGEELMTSALHFGVIVREGDDIEGILPFLTKIEVIAIEFTKFADGRGFSHARQLRDNYGYQGEIRALGDILPDQINYLRRCGVNAFVCRNDDEADTALALLNPFSVTYQADAVDNRPLYRRR